MNLEKESLKRYSKLFCKIGLGQKYRNLILELSKTESGRNALYKEGLRHQQIKDWQNFLIPIKSLEVKSFLDIGAGCLEPATAVLETFGGVGDAVEPNFDIYEKEYLRFFYKKQNKINLIKKNWQEIREVKKEYDLIVKTYNPWVSWQEIFEKTKTNSVISNSDHIEGLSDLGFRKQKVLKTFHFQDKTIGDISLYQR